MHPLSRLASGIRDAYAWARGDLRGRAVSFIGAEGRIRWSMRNADGSLDREGFGRWQPQGRGKNMVVIAGLNWLREYGWKSATTMTKMGWIALGSDGTAPGSGNTTLLTETARVALVYDGSGGDGIVTATADFGPGVGTGTVAEGGVFNDVAAGDMFDRFLLGPMTKGAGQTLTVAVTVTFTNT